MSALGAYDGWAVGDFLEQATTNVSPSGVVRRAVAEHWDGTSFTIPTAQPQIPSAQFGDTVLDSVAMVATNDVWAVGFSKPDDYNGTSSLVLIEHYDGTAWSVVPASNLNNPYGSNALFGVKALAANDIWAVGRSQDSTTVARTLVEHYDGTSWKIVPSPNPSGANSFHQLADVLPLSSTDVWAAGSQLSNLAGSTVQTLVEHWDGSNWTASSPPVPAPGGGFFNDLSGIAGDIWAVGAQVDASGNLITLAERFDGTFWSAAPSPTPDLSATLIGARYTAPHDVWAVGWFDNAQNIPRTPGWARRTNRTTP